MAKKQTTLPVKIEKNFIDQKEYVSTLADLKRQVREAQLKAAVRVNKELIRLYWNIGKTIAAKQETSGWGTNVIENLAKDLQNEFPGIDGFSRANVFKMRAFYLAYEKVSQAVRQFDDLPFSNIPWGHNILLLTKLKDEKQRLWYAQKTIEHGWSRSALVDYLKSDVYSREGKAITNFSVQLPAPQSQLAHEMLRDPYTFDFLTLTEGYHEKELEQGLLDHVQKMLIELGHGFAFVGSQYPLEVVEKTFYIDLLFYHTKMHCYVAVELKTTEFEPRDAGQINFYLSVLDDQWKTDRDDPSIGIILCKEKSSLVVEYALGSIHKPVGVSEYTTKLMKKLPKKFKGMLPTVEELESIEAKLEVIDK
jgi:predicted nuclease of restriction endonuclease-like (RecB) superfamily